MRHFIHILTRMMQSLGGQTLVPERIAVAVVTVDPYRGNLALKHDRSQHRRYASHYEDLLN